jgi:hypothetical protein
MAMMKGRLTAGRLEIDHGLDLTRAESLTGLTSSNVIKFAGGTVMGTNYTTGEWKNGIKVSGTLTEGTYAGGEYKGRYASIFMVETNTTNVYNGNQNGAIRFDFTREAGYNHTGGSEDVAVRINATNYCTLTSGGIRALGITATNRTGIAAKVQGVLITAHQRTSGGFTTGLYGARIVSKNQSPSVATGYQHALEVADESDGVQPALNSIVWIEKQSNSYTAATRAGIEIVNNCNTTYAQVITNGIYFKCGATGSNITNTLGFDSTDGTDGATIYAGTITGSGNMGRVNIAIGGTPYYILCYLNVDH